MPDISGGELDKLNNKFDSMIRDIIPRIRRKLARVFYTRHGREFDNLPGIDAIHSHNRESLSRIDHWVDEAAFNTSFFRYGMPDYALEFIDKDIGGGVTYTDVMLSLASRLSRPIKYLELGVSVGKNFYQMSRYLKDAVLVGYDIENINPVLAAQFEIVDRRSWPTMSNSIRQDDSLLLAMRQENSSNEVKYLSGDVLDENSWKVLSKEGPFNLVFSDALHTTEALLWEYEMFKQHGVLSKEDLIICWDDLEGEMLDAFHLITSSLEKERRGRNCRRFLMSVKGWMGENERDHCVGFFIG